MIARPPRARRFEPKVTAAFAVAEKELLGNILELCTLLGLKTAHFTPLLTPDGRWITPVQGDGKGFPDLVIAGRGGVLFAELKTDTGRVAPEQRQWLAVLEAAGGVRVAVWRTRDWRDGTIARELRALRRSGRVSDPAE